MFNCLLPQSVTRDIDKRVSRVIVDLGNPEPPLRLEHVRDLLRLDTKYYSVDNVGYLGEAMHRIRLAGKQIVARPGLLVDAVRSLSLKALWIPDRKRILIDETLPMPKQRWGEAHEIGHSLLPWHESVLHDDEQRTLSVACEQEIESEANYAAGQLLFLQNEFMDRLNDFSIRFDTVQKLSKIFGNSLTTTLWRTVETAGGPCFGMVCQHPGRQLKNNEPSVRYFIRSHAFERQFTNINSSDVFNMIRTSCRGGHGVICLEEFRVTDTRHERHRFLVECFFNRYECLVLGMHLGAQISLVSV